MSPRPDVSLDQVSSILLQHYHLYVQHVEELPSYDCRNFAVTVIPANNGNTRKDSAVFERTHDQVQDCEVPANGDIEQGNSASERGEEKKFVLKVFNEDMCTDERLLTTEKQIMCSQHLLHRGFSCPELVPTHEGKTFAKFGEKRYAELMTFLPGKQLGGDGSNLTAKVLHELGVLLAKMHQALSGCVSSEHLEVSPASPWALENMHLLSSYLHCIQDEEQKGQLSEIIATFSKIVSEKTFRTLKKGIIHGDFHDHNVIVNWNSHKLKSDTDEAAVSSSHADQQSPENNILQKYAIVDFEETSFSYLALELSRLIADMMIGCKSVGLLEVGGHVIAGYMMVDSAVVQEFPYFYETALACLAQYIVLKTHENTVQGGDNEWYVMLGVAPSQKVLEKVRGVKADDVYRIWANVLKTYNLKNPFC